MRRLMDEINRLTIHWVMIVILRISKLSEPAGLQVMYVIWADYLKGGVM